MRHLSERVRRAAELLADEATERAKSKAAYGLGRQSAWNGITGVVCEAVRHEKLFFRAFAWKGCTVLTFEIALMGAGPAASSPMRQRQLQVVVYFDAAPLDVEARYERPASEKRAEVRRWRQANRTKFMPGVHESSADVSSHRVSSSSGQQPVESPFHRHKVLVIDERTEIWMIREMLAVCLAQIKWPHGWENPIVSEILPLIGENIQEGDRHDFRAEMLQFVDPGWPGSYGDYRRRVKRSLLRKRYRNPYERLFAANGLLKIEHAWQSETRGKRKTDRVMLDENMDSQEMRCDEAARFAGIGVSSFYRKVKSGAIAHTVDRAGIKRVLVGDCLELKQKVFQDRLWQLCVDLRAEIRGTTRRTAQRWVERERRKPGADPQRTLKLLREQVA